MSQYGWNNCPKIVRSQVNQLVDGCRAYVGNNLIGVYLHGSLALDCFNPLRSDLDLLVITHNKMMLETKRNLADLLLRISLQPSQLEISFLRREDMVPWQYPTPYDFHYSEMRRNAMICELNNGTWNDWDTIQRYDEDLAGHIMVTYHRGICLDGSGITDVFPMVPSEDYLSSILRDVLSSPLGLNSDIEYPVYTILNACRTYAYLKTGRILSKDEGGTWILKVIPHQFQSAVLESLNIYRNQSGEGHFSKELVAKFVVYIRNEIQCLLQ